MSARATKKAAAAAAQSETVSETATTSTGVEFPTIAGSIAERFCIFMDQVWSFFPLKEYDHGVKTAVNFWQGHLCDCAIHQPDPEDPSFHAFIVQIAFPDQSAIWMTAEGDAVVFDYPPASQVEELTEAPDYPGVTEAEAKQ